MAKDKRTAQQQFIEALAAQFARSIPHVRACGMEVLRLTATGAHARMPCRPEFIGDAERGRVHTGIITTLVDSISGLAAMAAVGAYEPIATLDLRMDYLRFAGPVGDLQARAECFRLTRSIAFVRASAWQDDEQQPIAVSHSTFMRGSQRSAPGTGA